MKVPKLLFIKLHFLRHSPLMAKLLTTNKKRRVVLKIFSLVKHRNAAIFLVTISPKKDTNQQKRNWCWERFRFDYFPIHHWLHVSVHVEYSPISRDSSFWFFASFSD